MLILEPSGAHGILAVDRQRMELHQKRKISFTSGVSDIRGTQESLDLWAVFICHRLVDDCLMSPNITSDGERPVPCMDAIPEHLLAGHK